MTRINVGIEPINLPDELLLAELREIKRLPYFKRTLKDQTSPKNFTLGNGHIKFFMSRLGFAKKRYEQLRKEAEKRGFEVTNFSQNFEGLNLGEDWFPGEQDKKLIISRIVSRVLASKKVWWHYYRKRITKEKVIEMICG